MLPMIPLVRRDIQTLITNGQLSIALQGPPSIVEALKEYFSPWFQDRPGSPDIRVRSRLSVKKTTWSRFDNKPFDLVERLRNENTGVVRYVQRLRTVDDRVLFRIPETGTWIAVSGGLINVWGTSEDALMWDTKDILQRQVIQPFMLQTHGMLHASSVAVDGRAVLIVGRKGAGKSTTQFHLGRGGAALMSADRVFVSAQDPHTVHAHGYPARASLDWHTFDLFPELGSPLSLPPDGPKAMLHLTTIARRLGTQTCADAQVGVVLMPTRESRGSLFTDVPPHYGLDVLENERLDRRDPIVPRWLTMSWLEPRSLKVSWTRVSAKLADTVRFLEVDGKRLLTTDPVAAVGQLAELATP